LLCEHYACRCTRAAELAAMGKTLEAIAVHSEQVTCRNPGMIPCPIRSEITGAPCLLEDGHPQYSPFRFHRYEPFGPQARPPSEKKAERFRVLLQRLQEVPPEERQQMVDLGKADPLPKVRLFFEHLERELRRMGHLPLEDNTRAAAEQAAQAAAELVPRPGTLARAVGHGGSPLGDVLVEESDPVGDVVGPWWSGRVVATGERLVRLRPCHYAGLSEES
jgi:hypothetical protein